MANVHNKEVQGQNSGASWERFCKGLVFGFDVGTASIGYAVRRGKQFLKVGALICPDEIGRLKNRRTLRRQRRTLRNKKYRRQWFARELAAILEIDVPRTFPSKPIALRCKALKGEELSSVELFTSLVHLFKRRGYVEVPWAGREDEDIETKKQLGEIRTKISELEEEMMRRKCQFPCQLLAARWEEVKPSPKEHWGRQIYWPRHLLEKEFRAICAAQAKVYPKLQERIDWLLFGDIQKEIKNCRVYFKATEGRSPGILGMRWPRFDNRSPSLDAYRPFDDEGRPLHVVRKSKEAYLKAQWKLAILNFRIMDVATGTKVRPDEKSLARLQEIFESRRRSKKKGNADSNNNADQNAVKISESMLKTWAKEYAARYRLIEGQKPLAPDGGRGRARFCSLTLQDLSRLAAQSSQPILRKPEEGIKQALDRYLRDVKHPLVRHRLLLFNRLFARLIKRYGEPDIVIVEAVRSLALGKKRKEEMLNRQEQQRQENFRASKELQEKGFSGFGKRRLRYKLWKETGGICPFCLKSIASADLLNDPPQADIEHLVPRAVVDSNDFENLTVGHWKCNRERKGNKTPYAAFHADPLWKDMQEHARKHFRGKKLELFLSQDAEQRLEQKTDLQHTAYIAKVLRHVVLIQAGWLNSDGRDPAWEKQNSALRFQVTNGQLTSRLRDAWRLNRVLHALPPGKRWDDLSPEEREVFNTKNRGDLRHHALDAMVIVCTLPWLAHRTHGATDEQGNHGWWTQDEKSRSKAANPIGLTPQTAQKLIGIVEVQHHASRSRHKQAYKTTYYAKKAPHQYVARELFYSLTVKNLGDIYPKELSAYCEAAWERYREETAAWETQLKANKKCLPKNFISKLCFSHFQRWRALGTPPFSWPKEIKIPIHNVRLISVKDDSAVMAASASTRAFVKREEFKEVQIHLSQDGTRYVPVFVPYWKSDSPIAKEPIRSGSRPLGVIRKGMTVNVKKALAGKPPGKYRVLVTGQQQLRLLPCHVADKPEAIQAFGYGTKGLQPYWPDFLKAIGYEFPHPAPAQSAA